LNAFCHSKNKQINKQTKIKNWDHLNYFSSTKMTYWLFVIHLLYVYECFICIPVSVPSMFMVPKEAGRKHQILLGSDGCKPPCECWELNPDPLEEQQLLINTEPSLQPQDHLYLWAFLISKPYLSLNKTWRQLCLCLALQQWLPSAEKKKKTYSPVCYNVRTLSILTCRSSLGQYITGAWILSFRNFCTQAGYCAALDIFVSG
jgi:hypothetical protein